LTATKAGCYTAKLVIKLVIQVNGAGATDVPLKGSVLR